MQKAPNEFKVLLRGEGAVGKTSLIARMVHGKNPLEYLPAVWDNMTIEMPHPPPPSSSSPDGSPSSQDPPSPSTEDSPPTSKLKVNIWDTAPRERYDRLLPLSYPGTDVVMLCFSIVSKETLMYIKTDLYSEMKHYIPKARLLLVGCKSDLRNDPKAQEKAYIKWHPFEIVSRELALEMVQELSLDGYVECSAISGEGVMEAFEEALRLALLGPVPQKKKHKGSCSLL